MMKRQIKSLVGILLSLLLSLIIVSSVHAQSFDQAFEWIKRFQKGEEVELIIHVDTDSFTLFHSKQTKISQSTFDQLRKETPAQQIKILSDTANKKLEGLVIEYQVDKLLHLEETWEGNSPSAWKKIEFLKIASYPLNRWPDFIKQAISQGLIEYEVIEYGGESLASLSFKQIGPPSIQFGKRSLKFSDEFYEYMKISGEFKHRVGNDDRIVILVHEPHWLLVGQYQLIPGLKAFIEANSQYNIRFLVEGNWEEEIKYIPTKPTLNRFFKDVSNTTQVFILLRNFLIDGPFAYRLLYDPDLPALAIDDPKTIKKTPREPDFKDWIEQREVFMKIYEKLEKLPKEQRTEASQMLALLSYYVIANVQNLKGEAAIDYYKQLAELYDVLSNQLKSIHAKDFEKESSFLSNQAESCRTQAMICQYALERDVVMVKNIANHFESNYAERIPIVFIGNFHTPGIIDRLPKGISYVVIEPRVTPLSLTPPQRELDNFNDALKPETRPNYLKKLGGSLKGQVAPLEKELPYYEAFLKRETQIIKTRNDAFISSSPLGSDVTLRINNILEQNGILNSAQRGFAGGGQPPQPPFQGAFASFFYGPGGENPKMIFYDSEEENWKQSDRINYLKNILLISPYEKVQRETRKVSFYQDRETHRIFFWYFNPQDQIFYLYEWKDGMDLSNLLPLPQAIIHLRISIGPLMHYEKEEAHG